MDTELKAAQLRYDTLDCRSKELEEAALRAAWLASFAVILAQLSGFSSFLLPP